MCAFPTRHWRLLKGTIADAAQATIPHGLRDGRNGTAIIPDVVEFEMGVANYSTWPNEQIGKWAADDATNIYLQNFDPRGQGTHLYSVVARSFYSEDDANF
jgi:hypothetical protein